MKPFYILTIVFLIIAKSINAQSTSRVDTITYSGTRLTYLLVEAWSKEFHKSHPHIFIKLRSNTSENADLNFLAYDLKGEKLKSGEVYTVVSSYAQLPIANAKHPSLPVWHKRGLTEEGFKSLFFQTKSEEPAVAQNTVQIYKRERPACAARTFASHYGADPNSAKGKGINGDDKSLVQAVLKDTLGVSYNNLGFIYDLQHRHVIKGLSVIPIDFNKNGEVDSNEMIYSNLDSLISNLETGNTSQITIEAVNVVYKPTVENPAVNTFVDWILLEGQRFNHTYGFLNVDTIKKISAFTKAPGQSKSQSE